VPCPTDSVALRFVEGQLKAEDRAALENHLDQCARCFAAITELARVFGSELERVSPYAATALADSGGQQRYQLTHSARVQLANGCSFGRYLVRNPLGAGGMGTVYAAFDQVLHRQVALKVLHSDAVDWAGANAEQFVLAEARAVSALSHPNVVAIYDVGALPDPPCLYLTMELIEGSNFGTWRKAEPRSQEAILEALLQAGQGLEAIHERGLVHRDIKPDNILVGLDGRVRIADFGLAHFGPVSSGALAGTPAYMSPEQLLTQPLDSRSDQFSLAVVACEALSGARPFTGMTLDQLRTAMTTKPKLDGISTELATVFARALDPTPSARYPSMAAFLMALRSTLESKSSTHLRVNTALTIAMTAMHLALTIAVAVMPDSEESSSDALAVAIEPQTMLDHVENIGLAALGALVLVSLLWIPLGIFWAPLNAWGLHKRASWARVSTLVYAGVGALTCIGTPYAIYALYSLTRPSVKSCFKQPERQPHKSLITTRRL
jgi:hypothetical protein